MLGVVENRVDGPDTLHERLTAFNRARLAPRLDAKDWSIELEAELTLRRIERRFVEYERACVRDMAAHAPLEASAFLRWFEELKEVGPGQNDPLFPWLADRASHEQMRWFLRQEMAGEAGFDDLVAMTQVKLPLRAKL